MGEELIRLYTRSKNQDWSGSDGGAVDIYHDTCGYVYLYLDTLFRSLCESFFGLAITLIRMVWNDCQCIANTNQCSYCL